MNSQVAETGLLHTLHDQNGNPQTGTSGIFHVPDL